MKHVRGYISVAGGALVQLVLAIQILGTIYVTGNLNVYLASYLRHYDPSITLQTVYLILPLQLATADTVPILGSYLCIKYSAYV